MSCCHPPARRPRLLTPCWLYPATNNYAARTSPPALEDNEGRALAGVVVGDLGQCCLCGDPFHVGEDGDADTESYGHEEARRVVVAGGNVPLRHGR